MTVARSPKFPRTTLACLLAIAPSMATAHEGAAPAAALPAVPGETPVHGAAGADFDADADVALVGEVLRPAAAETMAPALGGRWSPVEDWPLVAVHAALLPNGKVLAWDATPDDSDDDPHTTDNYTTRVTLWDPLTNTHVATNNDTDTDLFCAGSAHLWDGRILFAGGDGGRAGANGPLANSNLYDPATNTWRRTENMNAPRWYSSVAALSNGEMLTFGGKYAPDPAAEVFRFDRTWRPLPIGVPFDLDEDYQWIQAAPDGSVISFGPQNLLASIDVSGEGKLESKALRDGVERRDYGSYAMFDVGRILVAGGGASEATAVVIDTATHQARDTGPLATGRRQHNLTILADGSVLATGGNDDGARYYSPSGGVFVPELWDPASERFAPMNPMNADRQYHSIALLLPDGRVLSAGGGICGDCYALGYEERNAAIFSPAYLFDGGDAPAARPSLASVPATADYGDAIAVTSDAAADLSKAHLIKLGSTTHSENQDQRLVPLEWRAGSSAGALELQLPSSRDVAPPGHYLLFVVDAAGVPSSGATIKLGQPLIEPGDPLVTTLEPGGWDSYRMRATGELELVVTADAPLELYVSSGRATDAGSVERATCRAAAAGLATQRCTVGEGDVAAEWFVSVHGAGRADYRLESTGRAAEADAVLAQGGDQGGGQDGGQSGGGAGEGAGGQTDGEDGGRTDAQGGGSTDGPNGSGGGGGGAPAPLLIGLLGVAAALRRRPSRRFPTPLG